MCIRDRDVTVSGGELYLSPLASSASTTEGTVYYDSDDDNPVSYTHLRAHETVLDLVCRLLLEKKKTQHATSILHAPNTQHTDRRTDYKIQFLHITNNIVR